MWKRCEYYMNATAIYGAHLHGSILHRNNKSYNVICVYVVHLNYFLLLCVCVFFVVSCVYNVCLCVRLCLCMCVFVSTMRNAYMCLCKWFLCMKIYNIVTRIVYALVERLRRISYSVYFSHVMLAMKRLS